MTTKTIMAFFFGIGATLTILAVPFLVVYLSTLIHCIPVQSADRTFVGSIFDRINLLFLIMFGLGSISGASIVGLLGLCDRRGKLIVIILVILTCIAGVYLFHIGQFVPASIAPEVGK